MVEDIIDICPDLRRPAFTEMKVLVNAKVYTPGSGSLQHISRRNIGIAEEVCADRRQIECVGIKNLVANAMIGVTGHDGPIARLDVEVANRVRRSYANIAGRNRKQLSQIQNGVKPLPVLANMLKLVCHPPTTASAHLERSYRIFARGPLGRSNTP